MLGINQKKKSGHNLLDKILCQNKLISSAPDNVHLCGFYAQNTRNDVQNCRHVRKKYVQILEGRGPKYVRILGCRGPKYV